MKKIGIICEYNPFHNGHIYHLKKIKELYPDSLIILVLNGYFLERGDISLISKEDKVKLALQHNIDLVVELPFVYGTQSADTFAQKSTQLLEELQCDYLIFGSEENNITLLEELVDYTIKEKDQYNEKVKKYLDEGFNYPTSLAKSFHLSLKLKSNDLLGISYIKSIKLNNYHLLPLSIKRTNDYLDTLESTNPIISATNIREKLKNKQDITKYVPGSTLEYLQEIQEEQYFTLLKYKIITDKNLNNYLDVDEGIDNLLKKVIYEVNSLEELITKIKSKRYTYNRLKRMFIHILVGFTKEDNKNLGEAYLKILGFNEKGQKYLNKIKKDLKYSLNPPKDHLAYLYELKAASLYDMITKNNTLHFELRNKPIKY